MPRPRTASTVEEKEVIPLKEGKREGNKDARHIEDAEAAYIRRPSRPQEPIRRTFSHVV